MSELNPGYKQILWHQTPNKAQPFPQPDLSFLSPIRYPKSKHPSPPFLVSQGPQAVSVTLLSLFDLGASLALPGWV